MPRIQKPYFALHQILRGQYSDGNEFILGDGSIYVGSFHVLPTGQRFSGFQPESTSQELFELRLNPTADILKYNQLTGNSTNKSVTPVSFQPNPTLEDYKNGRIERFLIQKRNNPLFTIMEIDVQQYNSVNTQNNPGINGIIWNKVKLDWTISKIPKDDAYYLNQRQLISKTETFTGIGTFLTNPLEFYK